MKIEKEITKPMLVDMVCGSEPGYEIIAHLEKKGYGNYNGSYGTWHWNRHTLEDLTESRLYNIYRLLSKSN